MVDRECVISEIGTQSILNKSLIKDYINNGTNGTWKPKYFCEIIWIHYRAMKPNYYS